MVDEESHEIATESGGDAPDNRDKRPDDMVIEGEPARVEAEAVAPTPEAEIAAPPLPHEPVAPPPQRPRPSGAGRGFAAGLLGGAVVAALAAAAAGSGLFPLKADLPDSDANRLAALESATGREDSAIAGLGKRLDAIEANAGAPRSDAGAPAAQALPDDLKALGAEVPSLEARVAKLEAGGAPPTGAQALPDDAKALGAEIPSLEARVAKLEAGGAPPADLTGVTSRIDKIESALAAPKVETRVADKPPSDNPAATAIAAETLGDKLLSGAPYPSEVAALSALGADPAMLAPLKALVDGAPTNRALLADFEAAQPKLLAAVAPADNRGVIDKFIAHMRGLVQMRRLGEIAGDDPPALASQIAANLQRGDLAGALAAYAKLPPPAQAAAADWASETQRKQSAVAAVQALREAAVARMAQRPKP